MLNYPSLSEICPSDRRGLAEADRLLSKEGIKRDAHLDYLAGLYDEDYRLAAVGGCFANTLRCLAVDASRRGEGLMNLVVSHLVEYQARRGCVRLFLYTKPETAKFFTELGFYEIVRVPDSAVFMENRKDGFTSYLQELKKSVPHKEEKCAAAMVMNCNPFTLGHRYLAERAAAENDVVHLFAVSEDASFFPFADRYSMIKDGCADLDNIVLHRTESYMISAAVFPSYFLEDEESAIQAQARLDVALFGKIAKVIGISRRYAGEEPFSKVTRLYNEVMARELPSMGIECVVVPRAAHAGKPISASFVRQMIHDGRLEAVRALVPPSTFAYLTGESGKKVLATIQASSSVVHY